MRTIGEPLDEDEELEGQDGLGPLIFHDNDLDSVMSGITFNSAVTREILDEMGGTISLESNGHCVEARIRVPIFTE